MARVHACLLAIALSSGLACRRETVETDAGALGAAEPELPVELLARLQALGAGPAFVAVVRPGVDGWPAVRQRLAALHHRSAKVFAGVTVDEPSLAILRGLDVAAADVPLDGWDADRPTLLATHDPILDGAPEGMVFATIEHPDRVRLRHQFVLPASDAERLATAIDNALAPVGRPYPEVIEGMPDAFSARVVDGEGVVAVFRKAHEVHIVAITDAHARDPVAHREAFAQDLRIERSNAAITPALELAASTRHGATGYVRLGRLRAVDAVEGVQRVQDAVNGVGAEVRAHARLEGAAILSGCQAVTGDVREIEDMAVGLRVEGEAVISDFVASLTPSGRDRVAAAKATVPRFVPLGQPSLAEIAVGLALPVEADRRSESHARVSLADCGFLSSMYLLMSTPMSSIDELAETWKDAHDLGAAAAALYRTRTKAVQMAITGTATDPSVGLVATYAGEHRKDVEQVARALARDDRVRTHVTKRGDDVLLLLATKGDPRRAFDLEANAALHSNLLSARIDTSTLPAVFASMAPRHVVAELDVRGDLLVGHTAWSSTSIAAIDPLVLSAAATPSTGEASVGGRTCLRELSTLVEQVLDELTDPPRRHSRDDASRWITATSRSACAEVSDDTEAAVAIIREYVRIQGSRILTERGETRAALGLVREACNTSGSPDICAQRDEVAALPSVELASVQLDPSCVAKTFPSPLGVPVWIGGGRVVIDGTNVEPRPAALAASWAAIAKRMPQGELDASLFVDRHATLGEVIPVLDAFREAGGEMVLIGSHVPGSGFVGTGLQLIRSSADRTSLPLDQTWQGFTEDISTQCELAALRF